MSMFICHTCDNLKDSHDGCEEGPGFTLICAACVDEHGNDEPTHTTGDRHAK